MAGASGPGLGALGALDPWVVGAGDAVAAGFRPQEKGLPAAWRRPGAPGAGGGPEAAPRRGGGGGAPLLPSSASSRASGSLGSQADRAGEGGARWARGAPGGTGGAGGAGARGGGTAVTAGAPDRTSRSSQRLRPFYRRGPRTILGSRTGGRPGPPRTPWSRAAFRRMCGKRPSGGSPGAPTAGSTCPSASTRRSRPTSGALRTSASRRGCATSPRSSSSARRRTRPSTCGGTTWKPSCA